MRRYITKVKVIRVKSLYTLIMEQERMCDHNNTLQHGITELQTHATEHSFQTWPLCPACDIPLTALTNSNVKGKKWDQGRHMIGKVRELQSVSEPRLRGTRRKKWKKQPDEVLGSLISKSRHSTGAWQVKVYTHRF